MPEDEKTEEPSQRQIQRAREKGDVPKSREINSAIGLLLGLFTLKFFGPFIMEGLQDIGRSTFTHLNEIQLDPATLHAYFIRVMVQVGIILSPIFVVMVSVSILTNFLQVGPLFATKALGFNFDKLNPLSGLRRLFSKNGLIETVKALLKIIMIGAIAVITIRSDLIYFQALGSKGIGEIFQYTASLSYKIGIRVALASLLLGILDLFYQRWSYTQKLRMSKQEVKEEHRESELSPEVKRVIREQQLSAAQRRMMADVPEADIVITNPTHIAVALKYDRAATDSPIVVAKGADFIAEKIKEIAREHDIPIVEDKSLAWALYENVELGETIPVELYKSVAEVLARIYRIKGKSQNAEL
ncbi:MAG: flagellar biosynthesis protein FlhB [Candidatus Poribacteria bacterium]|nr:flagellar biosynthesis protein FlhB [Candidatus Poribacteria bacterium]